MFLNFMHESVCFKYFHWPFWICQNFLQLFFWKSISNLSSFHTILIFRNLRLERYIIVLLIIINIIIILLFILITIIISTWCCLPINIISLQMLLFLELPQEFWRSCLNMLRNHCFAVIISSQFKRPIVRKRIVRSSAWWNIIVCWSIPLSASFIHDLISLYGLIKLCRQVLLPMFHSFSWV